MKNNIEDLRNHLFAALEGLADKTLEVDRAKAIGEVAGKIIDSAKVEVQLLDLLGAKPTSALLTAKRELPALVSSTPAAIGRSS